MPTIRVGEKGGSKPRKGDGSRGLSDTTKVVRHFPEEPCSDGILMASFDGAMLLYRKDVYFVAKLIRAERVLYDNQDVYLLSFEVNFMRSFAPQYRFRGADIDLTVQRVNGKPLEPKPSIRKIIPTVIAVDVSEREVNESNEVTSRDVVRIIDERVTILAELKEFLASKDKSDQVMKRLAKSMGISSPERQEDSSNEPAKKADETTKDVSILEDSYWQNQRTR
jgi:hypothetical protein